MKRMHEDTCDQAGNVRAGESHWFQLAVAALLLAASAARSETFSFSVGDKDFDVVSNSTLIGGAQVRIENRNSRLVGKSNQNPEVCGRLPDPSGNTEGFLYYQQCQGLYRTQSFPAERIAGASGYASNNFDQGNLNYDNGDLTQGLMRFNQDFNVSFGDFGFFVKGFYFYDFVNEDFDEIHRNRITPQNADFVGYASTPSTELVRTGIGLVPATTVAVRNDSRPCPPERNPSGGPCGIVYGPGGVVETRRKDKNTLREIGAGLHLLDINFYGSIDVAPLLGLEESRDLVFKVGRQNIGWGESTIQFFDSLNVINPPSVNNLFRLGGNGLDDFYQPINAVQLTMDVVPGGILSLHYQLEWDPIIAPSPGSYYSFADLGTNNAGERNSLGQLFVDNGFASLAQDPEGVGRLLDNPLSGITNTSAFIERLDDNEPSPWGQFGVEFKYYSLDINDGTEFGFYFLNYHQRTPFLSVYSVDESCAKQTVIDGATLAAACPGLPVFYAATNPNDPYNAPDSTIHFDSLQVQLEYPEDLQMYGFSFNTTAGGSGGISIQGEIAYRPNEPFQVAIVDLAFAGFGPTLTNCHLPGHGCAGSNTGSGVLPDGSVGTYGSSDFVVDANGTPGSFNDTFDAAVGHIPGSGRSFPSFVIPYRGGVIGTNPSNSYIRGWEEFDSWQFNIGGTYLEGNTEFTPALIGADQIIWLFEVAGRWIPDLPPLDRLQLEAPGIEYHASAGADGSGADRSRQACSTNQACSFGPDGLRFNPTQQDLDRFPDKFSAGYSLVSLIRYESLFPAISLGLQVIFKHDVYNTSPGLASNFIENRIIWDNLLEIRYKSNLSFHLGYQVFAGGGQSNLLNDRDNARFFIKYAI